MRPSPVNVRRGAAAVLAMLFLVILSTLTVGMYALSTTNVQTAANLESGEVARSAAESGLRWMSWRFVKMNRPRTRIGQITPAIADGLWVNSPSIRDAIVADFAAMQTSSERASTVDRYSVQSSWISTANNGSFQITVRQHPLSDGDPLDERWLRVSSHGRCGAAVRTCSMDFRIDKKVKFAVAGKVPIQLGRNTIVEGSVAMATTLQPSGQPPILSISDFRGLNTNLRSRVDAFQSFLKNNYSGYDNRINVNNSVFSAAVAAGFDDANHDGCIDEYDLFVGEMDGDDDLAVTAGEFTNPATGKLYDDNLICAIDSLGGPLTAGEATRLGYLDGSVDNRDAYAKVRGQILVAETSASLISRLASQGKKIQDVIQGPIVPENPAMAPVKFGATEADVFNMSPQNFDTVDFRARSGPELGGSSKTATVLTNAVVLATDANGGKANEKTPYGSTSFQATYERPVFQNVTFRNCRIPKGLNALFKDCAFEGTTFVEMEPNITKNGQTTTSKDDGMAWSKLMKSGSFSNTTVLKSSNSYGFERGNNLRFDGCTFHGPLASGGSNGEVPTAYTHFTNSWEFTGATRFDNTADETATIVAPQTNIEMGSFTNPSQAPSTLIGVVVAGNLDIRGTSNVDGSVIVSGDGAGNTTLGWFGASDGATDPNAMSEGGFGRLNIRYKPNRALPDGINIAIDISPQVDTYTERAQ